MSCTRITGYLASSPSASPLLSSQLRKASSTASSIYLRTKSRIPMLSLNLTSATSQYQRASTVCLFGGKGKSDNGNEGSPLTSLENALGNLKKEPSVEELLRQQIQKQEYYDGGGTTGKPPGGGGGGGGDGFGEAEDGGFSEMWNEFSQVILATMGFLFLYFFIIEGAEISVLIKDLFRLIFKRQKSIRLAHLIQDWEDFFRSMKEQPSYDPYWLESEILNTTTMYDSPAKYAYYLKALEKLESKSDQPESTFVVDDDDEDQY